ncbi:universal stress protein [Conexibacter stalactiti]|uniref:Universal stress protein n=1 Tax=Conexibacter stalactiti TaxID=1940611 RepID=A0ABU4HWS9_9ACTN|nr:universal stress protein [Conexibacter stalactiti]MDW5597624.1 universal stress protein [Conexibacter stalactiti]MEC5038266.1 universal stress protein [Conexibacter stalactiti]
MSAETPSGTSEARVVIGVDGSLNARLAALRAAAVFGSGARYLLVAVTVTGGFASERRAQQKALERTQRLLADAGATTTTRSARDGDPADELLAAAAEFGATTIVVGARGAEMFIAGSDDSARIGSVCKRLLDRREREVLVAHNPSATPQPAR